MGASATQRGLLGWGMARLRWRSGMVRTVACVAARPETTLERLLMKLTVLGARTMVRQSGQVSVARLHPVRLQQWCNLLCALAGSNTGASGNKCHVECSNRGLCNTATGVCKCFDGYIGVNCGSLK